MRISDWSSDVCSSDLLPEECRRADILIAAVGMATNIPPHNLSEVIDATIAMIDDPAIDVEGLMQHIPGPDFPTAGIINGVGGIHLAYRTGRGRVRMRAKAGIEVADNSRESINVPEINYQVNKQRLIEKNAELGKDR